MLPLWYQSPAILLYQFLPLHVLNDVMTHLKIVVLIKVYAVNCQHKAIVPSYLSHYLSIHIQQHAHEYREHMSTLDNEWHLLY